MPTVPASVLTAEARESLEPYKDLFEELTHEQIAEMAELDAEIVAAYHAAMQEEDDDGEEPAVDPQEPSPAEGEVDTVSTPEDDADHDPVLDEDAQARLNDVNEFMGVARSLTATYVAVGGGLGGVNLAETLHRAVTEHWGAPSEVGAPSPAGGAGERAPERSGDLKPPSSVRVTKKGRVRGPDGRPMLLGFRDVVSGSLAAFLWEHCRERVEPYPLAR